MDRSQPKYHVLIVSINSSIRLEFQSYLHKILGAHIAFDTIGLEQVQRPEQIKGYQCILFSSPLVQSEFPIPIPKDHGDYLYQDLQPCLSGPNHPHTARRACLHR